MPLTWTPWRARTCISEGSTAAWITETSCGDHLLEDVGISRQAPAALRRHPHRPRPAQVEGDPAIERFFSRSQPVRNVARRLGREDKSVPMLSPCMTTASTSGAKELQVNICRRYSPRRCRSPRGLRGA